VGALRFAAVIALAAFAALTSTPRDAGAQAPAPAAATDAATARIARQCNLCHGPMFRLLERNPHAILDDPERQALTGETLVCRNCHGDVTEHVRQAGRGPVFAFHEEPVTERNARCLSCHSASHPEFDRSPHARAGLACTSCHEMHAAEPEMALLRIPSAPPSDALGRASRVCAGCHASQLAELDYNEHHRVREGVLECTSCHDPHEPATRSLLGSFKQERCVGCHTDKGGPFVFEHPASRTEGCTACHSPHGSPNRHMLAHQRVAELCFTCHAAVPAFHGGANLAAPPRFGLDTQCTNCHSAIHGSSFDPFFLR
jgi:DmsE family decaheme c-type cytochrome